MEIEELMLVRPAQRLGICCVIAWHIPRLDENIENKKKYLDDNWPVLRDEIVKNWVQGMAMETNSYGEES